MFSPRKESTFSSSIIGDHHDSNDKVELEFPTQGRVTTSTLPYSSSEVHIDALDSSTSSPDEPEVEDTYSIARDRPRRTIRKPAHYATDDESGLIAYALIVAQETTQGIEPSTYFEAISCPNSSNWLMAMQEEIESLHKNRS